MEVKDIRNICNVGTGTMGHGTAVMFAKAGYNVKMYGRTQESIDRGMKGVRSALETYKAHQLVTEAEIPEILGRVKGVTSLEEAAKDADFVITGEGRTDFQTAFGKAPVGVAKIAKTCGVPVFCMMRIASEARYMSLRTLATDAAGTLASEPWSCTC